MRKLVNRLPQPAGEDDERFSAGYQCALGAGVGASTVTRTKPGPGVTEAQHRALHWLLRHGGSGVRISEEGVLAEGQEFRRDHDFWSRLFGSGMLRVEHGRVALSSKATDYCARYPLDGPYEGVRHGRVLPKPHAE